MGKIWDIIKAIIDFLIVITIVQSIFAFIIIIAVTCMHYWFIQGADWTMWIMYHALVILLAAGYWMYKRIK